MRDDQTDREAESPEPVALGMREGACRGLVSVVMPTYNRAWSLRKSVGSVFAQDYRSIECIVVDDGSTDETPMVMEELMAVAPEGAELRYFRKPNGGANSARNRGLIESRGEFVCFLDSDDTLLPESISARADALLTDPGVDFCYGLCSVQDESGKEVSRMNSPWPAPGEARIAPYLFHTNSPLIRRSVCARTGLWREDDTQSQEIEYFSRVKFFSRKVVFIDRVLSIYLRHDKDSILDLHSVPFARGIYRVLVAVKALVVYSEHDTPDERRELARLFRCLARQFYKLGDSSKACAALEEAFLLGRSPKVFAQWHVLACMGAVRRLFRKTGKSADHEQ